MYTRPHQYPHTLAGKTIPAPVQNRQALTVGAGRPKKESASFMDISGADGRRLISNQWNKTKDLVFKVEKKAKVCCSHLHCNAMFVVSNGMCSKLTMSLFMFDVDQDRSWKRHSQ